MGSGSEYLSVLWKYANTLLSRKIGVHIPLRGTVRIALCRSRGGCTPVLLESRVLVGRTAKFHDFWSLAAMAIMESEYHLTARYSYLRRASEWYKPDMVPMNALLFQNERISSSAVRSQCIFMRSHHWRNEEEAKQLVPCSVKMCCYVSKLFHGWLFNSYSLGGA